MEHIEILTSQDNSMIGSYKWWKFFYENFKKKEKKVIRQAIEDRMVWSNLKSGNFSIKAFNTFLALEGSQHFPTKVIWNS